MIVMKRRLTNKEKMEIIVGKVVIMLVESIIGCALILGFFCVIGTLMNWVEQSTFRTITYFIVMGAIVIKLLANEFKEN